MAIIQVASRNTEDTAPATLLTLLFFTQEIAGVFLDLEWESFVECFYSEIYEVYILSWSISNVWLYGSDSDLFPMVDLFLCFYSLLLFLEALLSLEDVADISDFESDTSC